MHEGRIIKSLSGFYYVSNDNGVFQCKGRGVFRKRKITPLVGDLVKFELDENNEGYIKEIANRKNEMIRPPVANLDQAIIVSSAKEPGLSTKLLDRFLILVESIHIKPIIFISKIDLLEQSDLDGIKQIQTEYKNIGYDVQLITTNNTEETRKLLAYFTNQITVISGQSGVGKSSLLNVLLPTINLKTDNISQSLGRGKHTTRHVELIPINNGLVADTPGFSSLEFDMIQTEDLSNFFPEMRERKHDCKFRGCMHDKEPNCAIKQAVTDDEITDYRYEHYLEFLQEIKSRKPRY